jgi:DNA-binding IclR family transcriptional regulator
MATASASPRTPRIQALARASSIIDVVAAGREDGVGLGEISQATELNKTTAFNLIASLVTLGFLEQDEQTRRYRLGLRNLELGRIVQIRMDVSRMARPILTELCKTTNETVNLGLPDLFDLLVVDSYRGSQILHATSYPGWRFLYHCTALGKAMLSRFDETMRHTLYRLQGLPRQTQRTITDVDKLEKALLRSKARGYALDIEENGPGVNGIAAPIMNGLGEVAAAVSVAGPSNRLRKRTLDQMAPDVIAAADAVTAAIGGGDRKTNKNSRRSP